MGAVTLTHVAALAGVSLATASRVLNGSNRAPAEAIAEKVRAAADELGYVANAQAQALARSTTGLVGLVVHDIADPYFSTITKGAHRASRDERSHLLLAAAERDEDAERAAVSAFVSYRADAVILAGSRRRHPDPQLAAELGRYIGNGGRVLTLGRSSIPGARFIDLGNRRGARSLVSDLVGRGLTRFAILRGPAELNTVRDRVAGYQEALKKAGLAPLAVVEGDFTSAGGHAAALECWQRVGPTGVPARSRQTRLPDPVCLLAANDVMALGAMTALRSLGLSIPDDVQIAGFDDIPTLRDHAPGLTTYRLPLELIGELAVRLALAADGARGPRIDGEVVIRESAG
jgi:LacI family transcriptional regulator